MQENLSNFSALLIIFVRDHNNNNNLTKSFLNTDWNRVTWWSSDSLRLLPHYENINSFLFVADVTATIIDRCVASSHQTNVECAAWPINIMHIIMIAKLNECSSQRFDPHFDITQSSSPKIYWAGWDRSYSACACACPIFTIWYEYGAIGHRCCDDACAYIMPAQRKWSEWHIILISFIFVFVLFW